MKQKVGGDLVQERCKNGLVANVLVVNEPHQRLTTTLKGEEGQINYIKQPLLVSCGLFPRKFLCYRCDLGDVTSLGSDQTRGGLSRLIEPGCASVAPPIQTPDVVPAKQGNFAAGGNEKDMQSPFAAAFLRRMSTSGLGLGQMMRLLHDDVLDATKGAEEPVVYGSLGARDEFFFNVR
jgi:hypothetical protein